MSTIHRIDLLAAGQARSELGRDRVAVIAACIAVFAVVFTMFVLKPLLAVCLIGLGYSVSAFARSRRGGLQ